MQSMTKICCNISVCSLVSEIDFAVIPIYVGQPMIPKSFNFTQCACVDMTWV